MPIVTVTGLVAGAALVFAVIWVIMKKQEFSVGAIGLALVGLVMIGMSQWSTIRISGGGMDIDISTLQRQVAETAEAVDALAEETVATANVAETTRDQLLSLSSELQRARTLPTGVTGAIRDSLTAAPHVDTANIRNLRSSMARIPAAAVRDTSRQ